MNMRLVELQRLYESGRSLYEGKMPHRGGWISPDGSIDFKEKGESHIYKLYDVLPDKVINEIEDEYDDEDEVLELMAIKARALGYFDFMKQFLRCHWDELNSRQQKSLTNLARQERLEIKIDVPF